MLRKAIEILDNIMSSFADKDVDDFLGLLTRFGVLSKMECKLVKLLDVGKLSEIFSMIKNKPEDIVFPALQKICTRMKLRSQLQLIHSNLKMKEMEMLIVPDLELQKHYEIFKNAIPVTQTQTFVGRHDYLETMHDLIENSKEKLDDHRSNLIKIAVTGLGGIGKTQLVLQFIIKYQFDYDSVIWINAQSYTNMESSFNNLGQHLGTFNKKMNIRANVERIYQHLSNRFKRNLLIFDNADDYIPSDVWFDNLDNFVLIITSRNRGWNDIENIIDIGVLSRTEASEFVKKSLMEENYDSEIDINNLTEEVQCFPLALQQAVAYIEEMHRQEILFSSSRFTINDYLREYVTERKQLLNYSFYSGNNEMNFVTVRNTWSVTVAKLKTLRYRGQCDEKDMEPLQIKILNLVSFLDGDQIDPMYFLACAKSDKKHLAWCIMKLEQYSLVNRLSYEQKGRYRLSVHKLVQEITIIRLQDENVEMQTYEVICRIMISHCPNSNDSEEDLAKFKEMLPHLASINNKTTDFPVDKGRNELEYQVLYLLQACFYHMGNYFSQKKIILEMLLNGHNQAGFGSQLVSQILSVLGLSILKLGHPKTSKIILNRSLAIATKRKSDPLQIAKILFNLSDTYFLLGNYEKQKELLEQSLSIQTIYNGPENIHVVECMVNLAVAYSHLGDPKTAKKLMENALKIHEKHYGANHPMVATVLNNFAIVYGELGNHKLKLTLSERALIIEERCYGAENIELTKSLINMSAVIGLLGDPNRQKMLLERVLKIQEAYFGQNHVEVATTFANLAVAFGTLGNPLQKMKMLEKSLTSLEKFYGSMHITVANTVQNLAMACFELHEPTKAKMHLQKVLRIKEAIFNPNHFQVAKTLNNLAIISGFLADIEEQKRLSEKALKIQQLHYGDDNIEIASKLTNLFFAHKKLGNEAIAKKILQKAYKIRVDFFGSDNPEIDVTRLLLETVDDNKVTYEVLYKNLTMIHWKYPVNTMVIQCTQYLAGLYATSGHFEQQSSVLFEREIIKDYVREKEYCLGEGSFGEVYKGNRVVYCDLVAIKIVPPQHYESDEWETSKIIPNCPFLCKVFSCFKLNKKMYIVSELCGGNLKLLLEKVKRFGLVPMRIVVRQLSQGYKVLHDCWIIHRNIKPENILFKQDENGWICLKIGDYGYGNIVDLIREEEQQTTFKSDSFKYRAPETFDEDYNPNKADMWSFGVVFYECFFGNTDTNFFGTIIGVKEAKKQESMVHIRATGYQDFDNLLERMLQPLIKKRISSEQFFEDAFHKSVESSALL